MDFFVHINESLCMYNLNTTLKIGMQIPFSRLIMNTKTSYTKRFLDKKTIVSIFTGFVSSALGKICKTRTEDLT